MNPIRTYGSLFSGVGGLDLGVEWATGARPQWFCESDPYCRAVLSKHWPKTPIHEDVRTFRPTTPVDLVCGGFPCQDELLGPANSRNALEDIGFFELRPELAAVLCDCMMPGSDEQ